MQIETILLRGQLIFTGDPSSSFKGPIKRGLRPIVWYQDIREGATSCSIVSDIEIKIGETKRADIVLLNQHQLPIAITEGTKLSIGSTVHKIADFIVEENLGSWQGDKVP